MHGVKSLSTQAASVAAPEIPSPMIGACRPLRIASSHSLRSQLGEIRTGTSTMAVITSAPSLDRMGTGAHGTWGCCWGNSPRSRTPSALSPSGTTGLARRRSAREMDGPYDSFADSRTGNRTFARRFVSGPSHGAGRKALCPPFSCVRCRPGAVSIQSRVGGNDSREKRDDMNGGSPCRTVVDGKIVGATQTSWSCERS